ncbi:MerR family transcriptional regulator [Sinomonas sp. JGH33]|uniref:MerR family transcriptional regulator n=1 Tax=Sinomonas terricola TaxID=3110330 RepID=A0ABU5T2U2_9MICC|nr:MerR family transcriptional regulator [Sinomonas sp. JGH33]MEA5453982.1 MerR family transcriptional regulator [Sinomonas sp. JGH33]
MGLTIAEVAERTGLSAHTLRYYERDGLMLHDVDRSPSGRREYSDQDVTGILMVARLRATGMPVREVRRYAELVRAGNGNERERLALLEAHRERVLAQLAEVTENLNAVETKIELYRSLLGDG